MKFGEKLTELRKSAGYSQQEVAQHISLHCTPITNRAVSKWETGACYPDAIQFLWLCELYGVADGSSTFLNIGSNDPFCGLNREGIQAARDYVELLRLSERYSQSAKSKKSTKRIIQLFDLPVSAGTGVFLDSDNYEPYEADDIPPDVNFAVRISGDSMEPLLHDGQIVFVQRTPTLEQDEIGIFVFNGDSYCKKLDKHDGLRLISLNEKYKPINIRYAYDLRVIGRVVF